MERYNRFVYFDLVYLSRMQRLHITMGITPGWLVIKYYIDNTATIQMRREGQEKRCQPGGNGRKKGMHFVSPLYGVVA